MKNSLHVEVLLKPEKYVFNTYIIFNQLFHQFFYTNIDFKNINRIKYNAVIVLYLPYESYNCYL